jgi:hypothetical protein
MVLVLSAATTGCRQLARRSASPTPLPTYDAAPGESVPPTAPNVPELLPTPTLPGGSTDIPPVPPSTAQSRRLQGVFGFTPPKGGHVEPFADDELPALPGMTSDAIQPTGSENEVAADEAIELPEAAVPFVMPVPVRVSASDTALIELDSSLFLIELFEGTVEDVPAKPAEPATVTEMTIQPQVDDRATANNPRAPQPWPADGLTPMPVITPGPVRPQWVPEPLPVRPANSRPRRLMIENSDSAIPPIE